MKTMQRSSETTLPAAKIPRVATTPSTASALESEPPTRNCSLANGLDEIHGVDAAAVAGKLSPPTPAAADVYGTDEVGPAGTLEYRRFLTCNGSRLSSWHDVPLRGARGGFNVVIEITRETKAKFEMATKESGTPIKQDTKNGKLRDYTVPISWNYGAFPQTWEQPDHVWKGLEGHAGDNDPLDVVEISGADIGSGGVVEVKPIAALAMIDEGEVDWKVIAINLDDPRAAQVSSLDDAERVFPGTISAVREWFTWYKAVDKDWNKLEGKAPNVFGFDGAALDAAETLRVIDETHASWCELVLRRTSAGKLKLC